MLLAFSRPRNVYGMPVLSRNAQVPRSTGVPVQSADYSSMIGDLATAVSREAVAVVAADWPRFARDAGLGDGPLRKIEAVIRSCLKRI